MERKLRKGRRKQRVKLHKVWNIQILISTKLKKRCACNDLLCELRFHNDEDGETNSEIKGNQRLAYFGRHGCGDRTWGEKNGVKQEIYQMVLKKRGTALMGNIWRICFQFPWQSNGRNGIINVEIYQYCGREEKEYYARKRGRLVTCLCRKAPREFPRGDDCHDWQKVMAKWLGFVAI